MTDWPPDWRISKSTTPPFDHLDEFNCALEVLEEIGPRFDTGKKLELLDGALFNGPRLRTAIEGKTLDWINGHHRLDREILVRIPVRNYSAQELLDQFTNLQRQCSKLTYSVVLGNRPSNDWIISNGLVFVETNDPGEWMTGIKTTHRFARVNRDWARFLVEFGKTQLLIDELRLRCLREGRILCFNETSGNWQMHPPDEWLEGRRKPSSKGAKYLLTADLPDQLLNKNLSKTEREERELKASAIRWLYSQYLILTDQDARMAKKEALTLIETKFGIRTKKVLEEVWAQTPVSDWRKPGRRKKEQIK